MAKYRVTTYPGQIIDVEGPDIAAAKAVPLWAAIEKLDAPAKK